MVWVCCVGSYFDNAHSLTLKRIFPPEKKPRAEVNLFALWCRAPHIAPLSALISDINTFITLAQPRVIENREDWGRELLCVRERVERETYFPYQIKASVCMMRVYEWTPAQRFLYIYKAGIFFGAFAIIQVVPREFNGSRHFELRWSRVKAIKRNETMRLSVCIELHKLIRERRRSNVG